MNLCYGFYMTLHGYTIIYMIPQKTTDGTRTTKHDMASICSMNLPRDKGIRPEFGCPKTVGKEFNKNHIEISEKMWDPKKNIEISIRKFGPILDDVGLSPKTGKLQLCMFG